jgi:hypothetical protein
MEACQRPTKISYATRISLEEWNTGGVDREIAIVTAERSRTITAARVRLRRHLGCRRTRRLLGGLVRISNGLLAARVDSGEKTDDVSVTPPASKDRGAEINFTVSKFIVALWRAKQGSDGRETMEASRRRRSVSRAARFEWQTRAALQREIGSSCPTTLNELLGNPGTLVQLVKVKATPSPLIPPLRQAMVAGPRR